MTVYSKIPRYDHPVVPESFFDAEDVVLLEKFDGSSFRFTLYDERYASSYPDLVKNAAEGDGSLVFGTRRSIRGCHRDDLEDIDGALHRAIRCLRDGIDPDVLRRCHDEHGGPLIVYTENFIERCPADRIDDLVTELEREGYWAPAMPLAEMYGNLTSGTNIWVAPDGEMTPNLEVKFPEDEFDRASLENAIDAHVGEKTIPIGPLELQIAYKLWLGGRTDLEDAAHLYTMFGETLSTTRLEAWVQRLDVEDRYDRLTNA